MSQPPTHDLDVRPLLAAGEQPFDRILETVSALPPGAALRLIAPFEPAPLYNVLARKGFDHRTSQRGDGDWEVLFTPKAHPPPEAGLAPGSNPEAMFWPEPAQSLDLTGLAPPEPMVRILGALEEMVPGAVLFALLEREPMFLFPELSARGHEWAGNHAADRASYRILIRRGHGE
ncbi:DUF2249 domain-containing protein [Paracoccus sp. Z118]|uniref:DUF2249 domain-containing protein n=1 Tax=Paracoccus sp. Z118 TaxID=2851017 RepID=UPI001C2C5E65|nr:DUF2249 domain-containing protein [Paracoccus sp. Z118]MBV0892362.1 DUF2249 domain-containing protein [Paracoccus sp. Z118]